MFSFCAYFLHMTKGENRAAARAYAAEKRRQFEEEQERAGRGPI